MYLHEDRELFGEVVTNAAEILHQDAAIIEKDYYVTMILKLVAQRIPEAVFKGGTSLSKCYRIIDRFSEDIDIAVKEQLGQSRRQGLKQVIVGIGEELGLPILNLEETRSRRDYNKYIFSYTPLEGLVAQSLTPGVILETYVAAVSFPVEMKPVDSFVRRYLAEENIELVEKYGLIPFEMALQGLDRTLADKVFALCDYYLAGKTAGHSRHLYDIYKLLPVVPLDAQFHSLVLEVRALRSKMPICPSALPDVDLTWLLHEMIASDIYKEDYQGVTTFFLNEDVSYTAALQALERLADSGMFE